MPTPARRNDSVLSIDLIAIDEENRQIAPWQPAVTTSGREAALEPPHPHRCDDANREVLRNHFPRE